MNREYVYKMNQIKVKIKQLFCKHKNIEFKGEF